MSSWDQDDFWDDGAQNTSADVQKGDGGPQWGSKSSGGQEGDTASDGQVDTSAPGGQVGGGVSNTTGGPTKGGNTKSKDSKMFLVIGAAILVIAIVSAVVVGVMHKRETSGSVSVGTSQVQQYQQGPQGYSRVQPLKVTKEGSTPSKAQPLKAPRVFKATASRSRVPSRVAVRTRRSLIRVGIPRRLRIRMLS